MLGQHEPDDVVDGEQDPGQRHHEFGEIPLSAVQIAKDLPRVGDQKQHRRADQRPIGQRLPSS